MWTINAADQDLPKKYTSYGGCLDARLMNELPQLARCGGKTRVEEEQQSN